MGFYTMSQLDQYEFEGDFFQERLKKMKKLKQQN